MLITAAQKLKYVQVTQPGQYVFELQLELT